MDGQPLTTRFARSASSLTDLPEYIITTFFPQALPLLHHYPAVFRFLGILFALYYFGPLARLKGLWNQTSSLLVSTITVSSEEDLFQYLATFIAEKRAIRPNQSLTAITNSAPELRQARQHAEFEEARASTQDRTKITYEQGKGYQIFVHNGRLFWVHRADGDGHSFIGQRYRRIEVLHISCLGRSVQPIKDMIENIYQINRDKEKSLTIIRRPYEGGYGSRLNWSRLTSKRRRMLDTVILQESHKTAILADVQEYMSEATKTFYADHGIPYRRGYLFYGPPGCGKTSFCLALASKFNLDVYILTLLDRHLTDTDLMSLLNQLPTPSLLLLEDVDEAGLSRKKPYAISRQPQRSSPNSLPEGAIDPNKAMEDDVDSDDGDQKPRGRVTLSGLLNAIDGVAAPEGHILIMTTNKPHELDEALVRAGRISVRVAFNNATQEQASQIFERMYIDQTQYTLDNDVSKEESAINLQDLAKKFGKTLPNGDFSPADLQDYLLIHKKDPEAALAGLPAWIEEKYDERKRREEEKEAEVRWKAGKAEERRRRWREDLKVAFKEGGEEGLKNKIENKEMEKKEEKKDKASDVDSDN